MTIDQAIWRPRVLAPAVELPSYPRDRLTVAYHEAAHAVLCCRFGIRIRGVVIYVDGGGKVDLVHPQSPIPDLAPTGKPTDRAPAPLHADSSIPRDDLHMAATQLAVMYLGGIMAELLLHGLSVDGPLALDIPDWRAARAVLKEGFGHDRLLYECQSVACMILAEHWDWTSAVAAELDRCSEISVQEIDELRSRWPAVPFETAATSPAPART